MYKRVLIKLSGEALSQNGDIFSNKKLDSIAHELASIVNEGVEVCVVLGGGNIFRGRMCQELGIDRVKGDQIGMLGTIMNGLALSNALDKIDASNVVMTAMEVKGIATPYDIAKARKSLAKGKIVIFTGGTSHPYFSTDTCSALRALEVNCEAILVAKNGVDGVYSADPKLDKKAVKFDHISYSEVLERNLKVLDLTAISLCKENKMPLVVFDMGKKGNIYKAASGEKIGTIVD